VGHTHRGMRNAHNILRKDTIKETIAQGVKGITAANPKSLLAGFYEQNDDGSWGVHNYRHFIK